MTSPPPIRHQYQPPPTPPVSQVSWYTGPRQPLPQADLEPFYRILDEQVLELSLQTKTPYWLLTDRPKPQLSRRRRLRNWIRRTIRHFLPFRPNHP